MLRARLALAAFVFYFLRKRARKALAVRAAAERFETCQRLGFRLCIVGAGYAGICLAIKCQEAGIPFLIFEKHSDLGGVWRAPSDCVPYPDIGCDVPIHLYSFSFYTRGDWSRKWAKQEEILMYMHEVFDHYNLRPHTRFNTEVTAAHFDNLKNQWLVTMNSKGQEKKEMFNIFVAATGQLEKPRIPEEVSGKEDFKGLQFHTARWPKEADLHGKRVVGVGNGPSAIQAYPVLAQQAKELTIVQRSPVWVMKKNDFQFPKLIRLLFTHAPLFRWFYRTYLFFYNELVFHLLVPAKRIQTTNALMRKVLEAEMIEDVKGKVPKEKIIPKYPLTCKRVAISDGWMPMLARENVQLETKRLSRVWEHGVEYEDGSKHDCDVIVWATGFKSLDFLSQFDIRNGDDLSLQDHWAGVPRCYKGITMAHFSNIFTLYGPGSNLGHSSIIFMIETQVENIMRLLTKMVDEGKSRVTLKTEAYERDFEKLQTELRQTTFVDPSCDSWYKTDDGVVVNNWSGSCIAYWWHLHKPDFEDYNFN